MPALRPALWMILPGYVLFIAILHLGMGLNIGRDDAEIAFVAQYWDFGYTSRQPPLYAWIWRAVSEISGFGLWPHVFVKSVFWAVCLLALYGIARRLFVAPRTAFLAVAALGLTMLFGWDLLQLYTHTVAMIAFMALTVWQLIKVQDNPSVGNYVLLGAAIGAGFLSKYAFILFLAALIIAVMTLPVWRKLLLRPTAVMTFIIALLVAAPHLFWMITGPHDFFAMTDDTLRHTSREMGEANGLSLWARDAGTGLWTLVQRLGTFFGPLPLLWLACFPAAIRPHPDRKALEGPGVSDLLNRYMLICCLIIIASILFAGVTSLQSHHLAVPFLFVSLSLMARAVRVYGEDTLPWKRYGGTIAVVTCIAVAIFIAKQLFDVDRFGCKRCYQQTPMAEVADQFRELGYGNATFVVQTPLLAGGLATWLPDASIRAVTRQSILPPPTGEACILLWQPSVLWPGYLDLKRWAGEDMGVDITGLPGKEAKFPGFSKPLYFSREGKTITLAYKVLPETCQ